MSDRVISTLERSLGKTAVVRLKNCKKLRGFDVHLNLVLRNAEDISVATKFEELGSIILRGDNIVTASFQTDVICLKRDARAWSFQSPRRFSRGILAYLKFWHC